jgi:hypothetical protein
MYLLGSTVVRGLAFSWTSYSCTAIALLAATLVCREVACQEITDTAMRSDDVVQTAVEALHRRTEPACVTSPIVIIKTRLVNGWA